MAAHIAVVAARRSPAVLDADEEDEGVEVLEVASDGPSRVVSEAVSSVAEDSPEVGGSVEAVGGELGTPSPHTSACSAAVHEGGDIIKHMYAGMESTRFTGHDVFNP